MTPHPARPRHQWTDTAALRDELVDIDNLTRDLFGPDVPLRDRIATLAAQWSDIIDWYHTDDEQAAGQAWKRISDRAGLVDPDINDPGPGGFVGPS
jgi:hypothetical protein